MIKEKSSDECQDRQHQGFTHQIQSANAVGDRIHQDLAVDAIRRIDPDHQFRVPPVGSAI